MDGQEHQMHPAKKRKTYIMLMEDRESGKAKYMYIKNWLVHSWTQANKMMVDILDLSDVNDL